MPSVTYGVYKLKRAMPGIKKGTIFRYVKEYNAFVPTTRLDSIPIYSFDTFQLIECMMINETKFFKKIKEEEFID